MQLTPELEKLLLKASNGNKDAFEFLRGFHYLAHGLDDVLDGEVSAETIKEFLINLFVYAKDLYSCGFYREHCAELSSVIDAVANAYADSVRYQDQQYESQYDPRAGELPWQLATANIIRSQGVDVIIIVAKLCGGYEHMREVSQIARFLSYVEQRQQPKS